MSELEEKLDKIREDIFNHPLPQALHLYHYTNICGLQGIIENSQWWATHHLYLNDGKEILYGYELIDNVLKNDIQNESDPWIRKTIEESISISSNTKSIFDVYVVAFSEEKDSLDQWRAYGDNGTGYSIGINPHEIKDKSLKFLKVTYIEKEQRKFIREGVDKVYQVLKKEFNNVGNDSEKQEIVSTIARYLARIRIDFSLSFKYRAFQNEKEWRVVIEKWNQFPNGTRNDDAYTNICYRSAGGIVVPFMKLDFQSRKNNRHYSE